MALDDNSSRIIKGVSLITLLPFFLVSCGRDPSFTLSGIIRDAGENLIYLETRDKDRWISIDSTLIINNSFQFVGRVDYPSAYYLRIKGKRAYKMLFVENQIITVSGSADTLFNLMVTGSATNSQYENYNMGLLDLYEKKKDLFLRQNLENEAGNSDQVNSFLDEQVLLDNKIRQWKREFIKNNRGSYATPTVLRSLSAELDADSLEILLNLLEPELSQTKIVEELNASVSLKRLLEPGSLAPIFSYTDNNGTTSSLDELYADGAVLLVFWASWCTPCREMNYEFNKILNTYRKRGLNIVGISLDSNPDDWKRAIAEDDLDWIHISDLQVWGGEVASLYNIELIPNNFFIDKGGIIIDSDISPFDLESTMSKLKF